MNVIQRLKAHAHELNRKLKRKALRKAKHNELRTSGFSKGISLNMTGGNPDRGCPYKGKDNFSGQFKRGSTRTVGLRVHPLVTSKEYAHG